jgi:HlyD family secretion protein
MKPEFRKKIVIAIMLSASVLFLWWVFSPAPVEVETAVVRQVRFERWIQEDGKTRVHDRYVVYAPISAYVARLHLLQGDAVKRGQVVASLSPVAPALLDDRTREEQLARIGVMEATLSRAKAAVERAVAALAQSQTDLKRINALAQQGYVALNQSENGRLNVQLREKEFEIARQDENAAQHQLDQARVAARQYLDKQLKKTRDVYQVTAPTTGKILKIYQQSEGLFMMGSPIVEIGDITKLEVVADILTEDAAEVRSGQFVKVTGWGQNESLTGHVRLIEPAAFTKISALGVEEQRVKVVIDFDSSVEKWSYLGDAYKVEVSILVQAVENAFVVPVGALFPFNKHFAVFVIENGKLRRREIVVKARNTVDAWIEKDLTAGTRVVVYPDRKLQEDDAVVLR